MEDSAQASGKSLLSQLTGGEGDYLALHNFVTDKREMLYWNVIRILDNPLGRFNKVKLYCGSVSVQWKLHYSKNWHMTQCQDEVRILSGRTQKLKVAKRCWKQ